MTHHFDLEQDGAYQQWRAQKLAQAPTQIEQLLVEVRDPRRLDRAEVQALLRCCQDYNMVIYHSRRSMGETELLEFARQLGLTLVDRHLGTEGTGISAITPGGGGSVGDLIPYSNRSLNWHTDGYYHPPTARIGAMMLHCDRPAVEGGINGLIDPELIYIALRDEDPALIEALQHPEAMTIPGFTAPNGETRSAISGPVFSLWRGGHLHMRFTARQRHIQWRDDPRVWHARERILALLNGECPHVLHHRLENNQGLVCNNVLHNRSAFVDRGQKDRVRRLLRVRFEQRIAESRAAA